MRSAAATFDDDLGFDPPARRKGARKPGSTKGKKKQRRFAADRVARYLTIGMSAAVTVGILVNALTLQKGHHPAPLFGSTDAGQNDLAHAASAAMIPTASSDAGPPQTPSKPIVDDMPPPAIASRPKAAMSQPKPSDAGDDAIARLLKGESPSASGAATADKTGTKTVLAVQKALGKLGFTVKASGTMGPMTRKAIEAFEKDRHVPVKGELTNRLTKMLAAETGLKIE